MPIDKCYLGHHISEGGTCSEGHSITADNTMPSSSTTGNVTIPADMLQQLLNFVQAAQSSQVNQNRGNSVEKPKRPTITTGITNEKWTYFLSRWSQYKSMTSLNNSNCVMQLLECCDEDLRLDLHRNVGSGITDMTEANILAEIKQLSVREENTLVSRIILRGMIQGPDEDVKHFAARIKGQADTCKYLVKCSRSGCQSQISYAECEIKDQLCKGLSDTEIQQEILAHNNQDMSLQDMINFVAAKESGKRSQSALSHPTTLNKISEYKKNKFSEKSYDKSMKQRDVCSWCGKMGHGSKANYEKRKESCPAFGKKCNKCDIFGHFSSMCHSSETKVSRKNRKSQDPKNDSANAIEEEYNDDDGSTSSSTFIGGINSNDLDTMDECIKIPHSEYDDLKGWVTRRSKMDPSLRVEIKVCTEGYKHYNLPSPCQKSLKTGSCLAIADTGARTTVAGMKLVHSLGLSKDDLIPVKLQLCSANGSNLEILGGIFVSISALDSKNRAWKTNQLCYIQADNAEQIYLSRTACEQLGIIKSVFPEIGISNYSSIYSNQEEIIPNKCNCPKRTSAPKPPQDIPYPATEENREKLEKWLLEYYGSSTFNVCEHQLLPLMPGPPLKLAIDLNAKPHAVHTPIPVPVHWKTEVKKGLDRDVRLGVIEPVPWGTPTTWCSRMVVVAKKDGTPRRTVDLQPLNAVSSRQTHHTPSPFHQAASVPNNTKKTVLDAWNGYHSVPIREEDRNLTTFITPWGRYRYCTAPQGYLAAGDAYTRRFDEIIADVDNKTKCVDDTIIWASDILENFKRTCEFLTRCGNNGITLNPSKFKFAKDTVEFAGFEITKSSVKPCNKYLEAIKEFPVPTDITGVRSWFGLVNQVSYAFSLTNRMHPFRELLKPGNKFYWDESLQKLFDESKQTIIKEVKDGVKIFEPKRKTCLITDWSKKGTGFYLTQKHCKCEKDTPTCCPEGWKIVFAGSKFNTKTESTYAPVEGECLAVVKALMKTRYFVLGCKDLIIATDHKPLLKVLGDRSLEDIHNPRLLNLKEKTLQYRFRLVHIPGKKNPCADAVSRYPVDSDNCSIIGYSEHHQDEGLGTEQYIRGVAISSLAAIDNLQTITWECVRSETLNDPIMKELLNIVKNGCSITGTENADLLKPFKRYLNDITTVGNILLYKKRIIIPTKLRKRVLENLHSAHQGVTSMISRAEVSIFWPGITSDIIRIREECQSCNKMAPSQPDAPPHPLQYPEYPFQHICADYFTYKGFNYLVIVDRYSNWPAVMKVKDGEGAKHLINAIKAHCETFGIPEEISSDGGPQFTAAETIKFLKAWGISSRVSSVGFPHSNCRAELAVKTVKRAITDNVAPNGNLDTDKFRRAILQYKNTPDQDTKLSPAQIVFGRMIRDFTPVTPGKYKPSSMWTLTAENREMALSKRHALAHERLNEHTRKLPALKVGDNVYIQNQIGNYPRKWDRSGVVVEVKQYDQYNIKVDGTGRLTLRNRKFLRKFTPFLQRTQPSQLSMVPTLFHANSSTSTEVENHLSASKGNNVNDVTEEDKTETTTASSPKHHLSTANCTSEMYLHKNRSDDHPLNISNAHRIPEKDISTPPHEKIELRRSTRAKRPNSKFKDYVL